MPKVNVVKAYPFKKRIFMQTKVEKFPFFTKVTFGEMSKVRKSIVVVVVTLPRFFALKYYCCEICSESLSGS